jgi:hypothetical protein
MLEGLGLAELQAKTEPTLRLADDWKTLVVPAV